MSPKKLLTTFAIVLVALFAECKKDKFVETSGVCPLIVSTDPANLASDVPLNKIITATFNEKMNPATITKTGAFTIEASAKGEMLVGGTVTYADSTASFTPSVSLTPNTAYTGIIKTSVKDLFGNSLQEDYKWTFTTIPQVTLSSSPAAGGTANGAGVFAQGSVVTVTATPNTGYTFTNWTDAGTIVSTSSSYQFTMSGNRTLVANFTIVTAGNFAVILSSNPAAGGTNNGSGSYSSGSTVTVTALPNTGYTFTNWTENGPVVSINSSYQFILNGNRTLVANYGLLPPASQFALILSSNPASSGTTNGAGTFTQGSVVTVVAIPNAGNAFTNWTDAGTIVSTSPSYQFTMSGNRTLVANFTTVTAGNFAINLLSNPVAGGTTNGAGSYSAGSNVIITASPNTGYTFTSWSGDASGSINPLTVTMNANKNITANFTLIPPVGPGAVNLGTAGNFAILTKSGISTTGATAITGDIGVSPIAATAITGFALIMDASGKFSTSIYVNSPGKVYASNYAVPTPTYASTAISDMQTAFTTANGLTTSVINNLGAGNISGMTLVPGLYKWSTGVLITNVGVTLSGGPNDTWVFQIAQDLTVNNSAIITLSGGAQAKNIFWVTATQATLGTNADFKGNILAQTLISLNTGAKVTGRLLAQTAVTLNASTVIKP
jgi:uncharacterized repeat protein (TIGR02543 family)